MYEENISCTPSEVGVAGGPSSLGLISTVGLGDKSHSPISSIILIAAIPACLNIIAVFTVWQMDQSHDPISSIILPATIPACLNFIAIPTVWQVEKSHDTIFVIFFTCSVPCMSQYNCNHPRLAGRYIS